MPLSPRGHLRRPPRDDQGAVAVLVAVFMVLLMGLAAIVVDLGFARDRARVAQNAADAAALAAAQYLSTRPNPYGPTPTEFQAAITRAQEFVTANGWSSGGAVGFNPGAYVVTVNLNPEPPRSFFGGVIGAGAPPVARRAAARWAVPPPPGACSVCILFGDLAAQTGDLFLTNGDIRVAGAITAQQNNGEVRTSAGRLYSGPGSDTHGGLSPLPVLQQVGPVPDPFLNVPDPPLGVPVATADKGNCVPGTYGSIESCTDFAPGVYVVTEPSRWRGNETLRGTGVLFYLTCQRSGRSAPCGGQPGGLLSTGGGVDAFFSPYGGPYGDLVVFGDRTNTAENEVDGGSTFSVGPGSFYMQRGGLTHGGNPEVLIGGNLVVGRYASNGNQNPARVAGTNAATPPPPAGGVVVLVD